MNKKKFTDEQQKDIDLLIANNEMYERTIKEAEMLGKGEDVIKRIREAKNDIVEKLSQYGVDVSVEADPIKVMVEDDEPDVYASIERVEDQNVNIFKPSDVEETFEEELPIATSPIEDVQPTMVEKPVAEDKTTFADESGIGQQYDVIPLPSNGECYPNKLSRVPVSYLTAYDENLITSPNLYRDGLIIEYLLKNKIVNKDVDVESLVSGDVDAIVLFLRATSYGTDFPITVRDPKTGQQIDTVIDLSKLKSKEFKLKGDSDGHFSFTLPRTKAEVKFRYLTRKDEKMLDRLSNLESEEMRAEELKACVLTIEDSLKMDKVLSQKDKQSIVSYNKVLKDWIGELEKRNKTSYSKMITNRMELQIVSINGNKDRKYIHNAVKMMPANDALSLRKYILENEPGIDFEITVERPESLGGGSFKTFLEWGDTVFLNLT